MDIYLDQESLLGESKAKEEDLMRNYWMGAEVLYIKPEERTLPLCRLPRPIVGVQGNDQELPDVLHPLKRLEHYTPT